MVRVKGGVSYRGSEASAVQELQADHGYWLKPSLHNGIVIYIPQQDVEKVFGGLKRILCLLMPYSGHFFPHINLLRLLASKGAFVRVYCDRKFQPHVPQEFISLENYPQEIVNYCQYIANYQKDRERAAKEYFSIWLTVKSSRSGARGRKRWPAVWRNGLAMLSAAFLPRLSCMMRRRPLPTAQAGNPLSTIRTECLDLSTKALAESQFFNGIIRKSSARLIREPSITIKYWHCNEKMAERKIESRQSLFGIFPYASGRIWRRYLIPAKALASNDGPPFGKAGWNLYHPWNCIRKPTVLFCCMIR